MRGPLAMKQTSGQPDSSPMSLFFNEIQGSVAWSAIFCRRGVSRSQTAVWNRANIKTASLLRKEPILQQPNGAPLTRRIGGMRAVGGNCACLGCFAFTQNAIEFCSTDPKQFCRAYFVSAHLLQCSQRMGSFHLFERREGLAILDFNWHFHFPSLPEILRKVA